MGKLSTGPSVTQELYAPLRFTGPSRYLTTGTATATPTTALMKTPSLRSIQRRDTTLGSSLVTFCSSLTRSVIELLNVRMARPESECAPTRASLQRQLFPGPLEGDLRCLPASSDDLHQGARPR